MAIARPTLLRDRDIRAELAARIDREHYGDAETLVVPELGLKAGRFRIDMAVINGSIHGYEIKSAADTLERLPAQAVCYGEVCDFVTIVTTPSHIAQVRRLVPTWWGILLVRGQAGGVQLHEARKARPNPAANPFAVAQLLWKDEALELLEEHGLAGGVRGKPRAALWRRLADSLPLEDLSDSVRLILRRRPSWRADPQPV